mmetsp:Transcript_28140/g.54233  ORF Transcript_28140/g.54233 Transcript_28140/m.54233 type:complete len:101 (+) Transcript_28140:724-1026(+)
MNGRLDGRSVKCRVHGELHLHGCPPHQMAVGWHVVRLLSRWAFLFHGGVNFTCVLLQCSVAASQSWTGAFALLAQQRRKGMCFFFKYRGEHGSRNGDFAL